MNGSTFPAIHRHAFILVLLLATTLLAARAWCEERTDTRPDPLGTRELLYRDGVLSEDRLLDKNGAILEESYFADGILVEKRNYIRANGSLLRIESSDGEGSSLGTISYRYDTNGRLIALNSTGSFGTGGAGMLASGGAPRGAWIDTGGTISVNQYDDRGRPMKAETIKDGKAVKTEKQTYGPGAFPRRTEVENSKDGSWTRTDYDDEGRALLTTETLNGNERSRKEFRYDQNGLLAEELTRTGGLLISRKLSYDPSGSLLREEIRRNAILERVRIFEGDHRIEELYERGVLFVRAFFSGGRKTKDEFYFDGALVRMKEYR